MKLAVWLLFLSSAVLAQVGDPSRPDLDVLNREGQLFSIKIVPQEPLKILVVGREEAALDVSQFKLWVKRLSPGPGKTLLTRREGNAFVLKEELDRSKPIDLEVIAKPPDGKKETFRFQIPNTPR